MRSSRDQYIYIHLPSHGAQSLGISQRHHLVAVQHAYPQWTVLQHK